MSAPGRAGTKVCPPPAATRPDGFLAALPERARRALVAGAVEREYVADAVLFLAGSPARNLYVVLEGRVRVLRAGGGRPHVVHAEGPGGTLGEVPLFEGTTYPATAVAAEPTRCLVLARDAVLAAVRTDPEIALALLARLAGRVRSLVERMDRRAGQSIVGQLAELALVRHRETGGAPFALGRTQQDVAEELGTVRELVVRGLRMLRESGAVRAAGRGLYVVADEEQLWAMSRRR